MRRFVGVLLEFDAAVNPEPGVARAPTIAEQVTALARLAERLGGRLEQELLIARRGKGLDSAALDHLVSLPVDGVLLFSLDSGACSFGLAGARIVNVLQNKRTNN